MMEIKPIKTKPQFYAVLLQPLQEIAKDMGYNLIVHGSMNRDLDLIAVAWVDDPKPEIEVVQALDKYLRGAYITTDDVSNIPLAYLHSVLPGGRNSYVINLYRAEKWNGYVDAQYYLDISFTPQLSK